MEKTSHLFHESNNEDLLTLSLATGPKSPLPATSTLAPPPTMGQQILQAPPPVLSPQTSFNFQPFLSIPEAPPLPPYYSPNYQAHTPADINPNDNVVPDHQDMVAKHSRPSRSRRNPFRTPRQGKTEIIPQPFPWATTQRAMVNSLHYLLSHNITTISGDVQCKKCEKVYKIEYDLEQKFGEIATFISENKFAMHDRAPSSWMNPNLPSCETCGNCVKPIVSKKREINWLFLLLGQMLGCCKLSQLKYFCKHTKNHRTGAKDRVLYLTYLGLCRQLDPNGPFDV